MKPLRLVVCGASGRMGTRVLALARADARFSLLAEVGRAESARFPKILAAADAAVDFSLPAASARFAAQAAALGKPLVVGTTGFSAAQARAVARASAKAPIFLAPNFSLGVNVMLHLAETAARLLSGYDAGIVDSHHRLKRDAPSGTALALAESVRRGRKSGDVPIVSLRMGDIVGEHVLTLAGPAERLELSHRAHSRDLFARGALEAALWVHGRKPGLYGMKDLLGLR